MIPLVLSGVALVLALIALTGFVALLIWTHLQPDPEPPPWVNHGATRRRCDRPTRRGHWREDCTT